MNQRPAAPVRYHNPLDQLLLPQEAYNGPAVVVSPFPLTLTCIVNIGATRREFITLDHEEMKWLACWKVYKNSEDMKSVVLTLALFGTCGKTYKVAYSFKTTGALMASMNETVNRGVFDDQHQSVCLKDAFTIAETRTRISVHPVQMTIVVTIHSMELIPKFELHNQTWPLGTAWMNNGVSCAVRVNLKVFRSLNQQFKKFRRDLCNKVVSPLERDAFYDFAGLLSNKWFTGGNLYLPALRNGFKLGFTHNWEEHDRPDSDLDFIYRTFLPTFQHIGDDDFPTHNTAIPLMHRQVLGKESLLLFEDNPFLRSVTFYPIDTHSHHCQFHVYLEKIENGPTLLMGAAIFTMTNRNISSHWMATGNVQIFVGEKPLVSHRVTRIIHPRQRTIGMVLAVVDEKLKDLLENKANEKEERIWCMFCYVMSETTMFHIPNNPVEGRELREAKKLAKRERADRRRERKLRRSSGKVDVEPDSEEELEVEPDWVMPGLVDAYIECLDGKKIGVNSEYLSGHSHFFEQKFKNQNFNDCGSMSIQVEEDRVLVWYVLEILWHRSLLITPYNYEAIVRIGDYWGCPVVSNYVEMALLKTNLVPAEEKQEVAIEMNFDVMNYILRHPEYASDFNIVFEDATKRITVQPNTSDIDGGPEGTRGRKRENEDEGVPFQRMRRNLPFEVYERFNRHRREEVDREEVFGGPQEDNQPPGQGDGDDQIHLVDRDANFLRMNHDREVQGIWEDLERNFERDRNNADN